MDITFYPRRQSWRPFGTQSFLQIRLRHNDPLAQDGKERGSAGVCVWELDQAFFGAGLLSWVVGLY